MKLQKHDTQIERSDQEKICAFSRANMKASNLRDEMKKLKEDLDNLEDATMLVEESMGEGLKLFLGECFITVNEEQATQYVEKLQEEQQEELDKKNDKLEVYESQMKNLKSFLYARFGQSINLEEDAE